MCQTAALAYVFIRCVLFHLSYAHFSITAKAIHGVSVDTVEFKKLRNSDFTEACLTVSGTCVRFGVECIFLLCCLEYHGVCETALPDVVLL